MSTKQEDMEEVQKFEEDMLDFCEMHIPRFRKYFDYCVEQKVMKYLGAGDWNRFGTEGYDTDPRVPKVIATFKKYVELCETYTNERVVDDLETFDRRTVWGASIDNFFEAMYNMTACKKCGNMNYQIAEIPPCECEDGFEALWASFV
jgi:hypothetical protein